MQYYKVLYTWCGKIDTSYVEGYDQEMVEDLAESMANDGVEDELFAIPFFSVEQITKEEYLNSPIDKRIPIENYDGSDDAEDFWYWACGWDDEGVEPRVRFIGEIK